MNEPTGEWNEPGTSHDHRPNVHIHIGSDKIKERAHLTELKRDLFLDDHLIPMDIFCRRHCTDAQYGLSKSRAEHLLQLYGPNKLKMMKESSKLLQFFKCFFGGFAVLLWIGAVLCIVAYFLHNDAASAKEHLYLASVLIIVVIVTGFFTHYQQRKSSKIMEAFETMMPQNALVIRDGDKVYITAEDIVIGDLVILKIGDRVPADMRVVESQGLKVDNSALTGESEPARRLTEHTSENPIETKNLVFYSTTVVEGTGKGVVIACGDHTVMGRIAELTTHLTPEETPIAKEIKIFIHMISIAAVLLGMMMFFLSMIVGYYWIESLIFLIAIIVANVPEGLLVTVTMSLTRAAQRMAKKNCLVKNLEAVETLGSTTVICSDKTGTLTQNLMTVSHLWFDKEMFEVGISDDGYVYDIKQDKTFQALSRVAMLCSVAEFSEIGTSSSVSPSKRLVVGDASEAALLRFFETVIGEVARYRQTYKKVCEVPFSSERKFQLSVHVSSFSHSVSPHFCVIKGAPERLFSLCSTILLDGEESTIDEDTEKQFVDICQDIAGCGERVMGFADLQLPRNAYPEGYAFDTTDINFPLTGFRFIGLISLRDPPRVGVSEAVAKCRSAGIRVVMVTGDHPVTAKAIAVSVGIISHDSVVVMDNVTKIPPCPHTSHGKRAAVIHGSNLREFSDDQLDTIVAAYDELVFARTSPTQKLNIVESFQRLGHVVAVTGDGINDSPALKKASIGISMGITGCDVTKKVADMILLDDNFATIVNGIEEGRLIFDNLKKSIAYTLTSNTPEMLPFLLCIFLKIPLPLGVLAILCINIGTDLWPAISLAYEPAESDIMYRRPRNINVDRLVNRRLVSMAYVQIGLLQAAAGFHIYFLIMAENGFLPYSLLNSLEMWDAPAINDLEDSFGQEWTYRARKRLEYTCHTGFFVAIVVVQWADLLICKTRRLSLFQQGMSNWALNFGLVFETALTCFLVYTPGLNHILKLYEIKLRHWLMAVPYAIVILLYDEMRKYLIRKYPGCWVERLTYY